MEAAVWSSGRCRRLAAVEGGLSSDRRGLRWRMAPSTVTERLHHHHPHHYPSEDPPLRLIGVEPSPPTTFRSIPRHPIRLRLTRARLLALLACLSAVFLLSFSYLALPMFSSYRSGDPLRFSPYSPTSRVPQVCSHKVFLPTTSISPLADSFPPPSPPSPYPLHAVPPMLPNSLVHFLYSGISCFDVDLFLTADDVLFMGHPTDAAAYLASTLPSPPPQPTAPTLYVETLTSWEIERMDPLGYVPRFSTVVSTLRRILSVPSSGRLPLSFVNVEPKGRLNSHEGFMRCASVFAELPPPLTSVFILIVDLHQSAAQVQKYYPAVPLTLALRDRNVSRDSSAGWVCDAERTREQRDAVMLPYKFIWPSETSIGVCGQANDGGPDLIQAARKRGKLVGTWSAAAPTASRAQEWRGYAVDVIADVWCVCVYVRCALCPVGWWTTRIRRFVSVGTPTCFSAMSPSSYSRR